jgi:peptidoglycan/LPS O-acetylase OafA/YrhL
MQLMKDDAKSKVPFRQDINGLRAWAVGVVVFYHFDVPGFTGGFVGVDVFFVISGFLMTGIVANGLERGNFSIIGFYLARARRIVPALVVLCAALIATGWLFLLPPDYKSLGSHVAYALTFVSNIEFWLEAGYFDVVSHEKWLLHTWSLSVEWQFYLVLPLLLLAVWKFNPGRQAQLWIVGLGIVASLLTSVLVTNSDRSAAFFLLHSRAWEMLGGGLVFLLAPRLTLTFSQRRWLSAVGLALIVLAVVMYDKDSAWPGWRAALPVGAAMMVLTGNTVSFWTANGLAQWIGNRSYSIYLWHWPVVVGLVYLNFRDVAMAVAGAILLSILLGHLSYVWVELPSQRLLGRQRWLAAASSMGVAMAVVVMSAVSVWKLQGVGGRFAADIELAAAEAANDNPRKAECLPNSGLHFPSCVYGGADWKVIAIGDSHTSSLVTGLSAAQNEQGAGVVQWNYSGCVFVDGLKLTPAFASLMGGGNYNCKDFIAWAAERLESVPRAVPIVIINRYAKAAFGQNENLQLVDVPEVYFSKVFDRTTPEFLREFAQEITRSACRLAQHRKVYLVRPIPEMGFNVPNVVSRQMVVGIRNEVYVSMDDYRRRNAWVWAAQDAARDQCGVKILDPTAYLCRDNRCYGSKNGRPLYVDDDHLSEYGNKLLVPMFAEVFRAL